MAKISVTRILQEAVVNGIGLFMFSPGSIRKHMDGICLFFSFPSSRVFENGNVPTGKSFPGPSLKRRQAQGSDRLIQPDGIDKSGIAG